MTFQAEPHLAGLKDFQRHTVEHIIDRFYGESIGPERTGRFLVADETGLGKSIVARGVIARAVEHLEAAGQRRITVLYVCSNHDLARQNLRRLNITGDRDAELDTRLSMLATRKELIDGGVRLGGATFTLIPLTPGTSLQSTRQGFRTGKKRERALLAVILEQLAAAGDAEREAGVQLLHGSAALENFRRDVEHLRSAVDTQPLDQRIVESFAAAVRGNGLLKEFIHQCQDVLRSGEPAPGLGAWNRRLTLIADLRRHLARAGADVLEPDLIVLDEFQRFRQLLAAEDAAGAGESLELAHTLFNHSRAKLLLLSATPYAPYTQGNDAEDHHADFLSTVDFLNRHRAGPHRQLQNTLAQFRASLTRPPTGLGQSEPARSPSTAAAEVREVLLPVMSRSERPPLAEQSDLVEVIRQEADSPLPADFADWIILKRLGDTLNTRMSVEYWKSVPHFSTFMEGYQFGHRVRDRIAEGDEPVKTLLRQTTRITRHQVERHDDLDLGHGYLQRMVEQTVGADWWKMLWLPSSMPYTQHGLHYRPLAAQSPTKRLIFSAWRSVPTAVACLLSYEADRQIIDALREQLPADRRDRTAASHFSGRLSWGLREDGDPATMNAFSLFWPHPGLAAAGDPLAAPVSVDDDGGTLPTVTTHRERAQQRLRQHIDAQTPHSAQPWEAVFSSAPGVGDQVGYRWLREMGRQERETSRNWDIHLDHVTQAPPKPHWHDALPVLAAHSPGSLALRCVTRMAPEASEEARLRAAWTLSLGLRNLFNRGDTARLLTALYGMPSAEHPYWLQVTDYCADGGLESVLDEYLFQLASDQGPADLAEDQLLDVAQRAVIGMSLLPAAYVGHDYTAPDPAVPFSARYALRYGGRHQSDGSDSDAHRQGEVRSSFNSPFPPFVLASTSVGQEGIDFHWWCHRVVHWNLPSNPVDFEQREGRVNRFGGHAVRKNVAHHHALSVLTELRASQVNPWRRAFAEAEARPSQHGAFSPWWIYPGPTRIQRVIMSHPHSRDMPRYERLRDLLTSYRLTLGQPRQEDMLALIGDSAHHATIDLSPPTPRG